MSLELLGHAAKYGGYPLQLGGPKFMPESKLSAHLRTGRKPLAVNREVFKVIRPGEVHGVGGCPASGWECVHTLDSEQLHT